MIAVSDRLIVKAAVDETDIAQVKVGQKAHMTLDAYPTQPFEGKAVQIAYDAIIVSNVTNYTVEVMAADKIPPFMRSGMTATGLDFYTDKHPNVLQIPNDAIQPRKDGAGHGGAGGSGNAMANALSGAAASGADGSSGRPQGQGGWNGQHGAGGHDRRCRRGGGHGRKGTVLVPGPLDSSGKPGDPVEKEVHLGMTDGKNTEVLDGLAEGDTVLLKTMSPAQRQHGQQSLHAFGRARPAESELIKVKDLRKTYHLGDSIVRALDGVDLTIEDGDFVAIMGPSGSGKSTMLQVLGLLDNPDGGSYELFGRQVAGLGPDALAEERSRRLGFIFQQFNLFPRTRAAENVRLPALYHPVQAPPEKAIKLLQMVGLGERTDHKPNELSGGQQQRVAIARALYNDPVVVFADEPTGNLDSKSTVEILKLLQDLNAKGITIVMVTHEPEVGAMARRRIVMRDGKITEDKRQKPLPPKLKAKAGASASHPVGARLSKLPSVRDVSIYVQQAMRSLLAIMVRSALSMLGILIGVAAVIAVQAIGDGAKKTIQAQLASLGSNLLMVQAGAARVGGVSQGSGTAMRAKFTDADLEALKVAVPTISRATGDVSGRAQATADGKNWNTSIIGTGMQYPEMHDSAPVLGRWFTQQELQTRARVAIVGVTVANNLWGNVDPVGETIRLNRVGFQVIGVLPAKGTNGYQDQDDKVIIPSTTAALPPDGQGVPRQPVPGDRRRGPHAPGPGRCDRLPAPALPHPRPQGRLLQHPQHGGHPEDPRGSHRHHVADPGGGGRHLAAGGRHRHHEHHAGHGHRAHARDRPAQGPGGQGPRHPQPVPHREPGHQPLWRGHGLRLRGQHVHRHRHLPGLGRGGVALQRAAGGGLLQRCGPHLRALAGADGGPVEPHHGLEIRIGRPVINPLKKESPPIFGGLSFFKA